MQRFLALPGDERRAFLQAWCLLGAVRVRLLCTPFKRLVAGLEHWPAPRRADALHPGSRARAKRLGWLVTTAARYTPWRSPCLAQVLVLQRMLAARGIPGQFHLGVRKQPGAPPPGDALSAHAWLSCGDAVINGAAGHEQFTVVSTFSWGGAAG